MPNTRPRNTLTYCLIGLLNSAIANANGTSKDAILTDGGGSAYASRCNAEKQSWLAAAGSSPLGVSTFESTTTITAQTTIYTTLTYLSSSDAVDKPFTLCDGFPRIHGSRTIITDVLPYETTSIKEVTTTVYTSRPAPSCIINKSDCDQLSNDYSKSSSIYQSYLSVSPGSGNGPTSPYAPICGPVTKPSGIFSVGDVVCAMKDASVQLLYWPVTAAASCDACHRNHCPITTHAPSMSGKPNTAIWRNMTLTSPTAYLAFQGKWAYTSDGKAYTDPTELVVPQKPEQVSSLCGKPGGGYGKPQAVNYLNFQEPVPADVYRCQPSCYRAPLPYQTSVATTTHIYTIDGTTTTWTGTQTLDVSEVATNLCSTIWDDYAPVLAIPEAFKTIEPAGFNGYQGAGACQFIFDEDAVLYDPPVALVEAQSVIKPKLPAYNPAVATYINTYTALPAETGNLHPAGQAPQHSRTSQAGMAAPHPRPTPASHVAQTATALEIGGYIAHGIGLTVPKASGNGHESTDGNQNAGEGAHDLVVALAPGGSGIIVNGHTKTISAARPQTTLSKQSGMVSVAGKGYHFTKQGSLVTIDGQTLSPGTTATINGRPVKLTPDGAHIVVGSDSGEHFTAKLRQTATTTLKGVETGQISISGGVITYSIVDGATVVNGQTLRPHHTVTVTHPHVVSTATTTKHAGKTGSSGTGPSTSKMATAAANSPSNPSDWRCQAMLAAGLSLLCIVLAL